jgi:hypothetical protein
MTTASKTANDKTGTPLYAGDEIVMRASVIDVVNGHVLTHSIEPPNREFWFAGNLVERSAQGLASRDADRRAALPIAVAAPAAAAAAPVATLTEKPADQLDPTAPLSLKEQAIAFAMTKGYKRDAAEKIVEEHGTRYILSDRDEEEALNKAKGLAGSNGGTVAGTSAAPASAPDPSAKPGNAAAENQAATPGTGTAPAN